MNSAYKVQNRNMKSSSLPSFSSVLFLLFLGFFSVQSLGHDLQYQDARPLKKKLPIEKLDESYLHKRHKRDADGPIKNVTFDNHKYYKSSYSKNDPSDWFELSNHTEGMIDHYLSRGYLKTKNFKLKFTFPYYGHPVTNATVTTGGFIYVGYVETSLITRVMYIAPFMAPFNPSLNESAAIYYFSNATQFTVQWTNVHLMHRQQAGPFTFQVSLYKDGRIRFAYKSIPLTPGYVSGHNPEPKHPVQVGISDAFFGYRTYYNKHTNRLIKVRVFFVYHKVNKTNSITSNASSLLLIPFKTCIAAKSCEECTNLTQVSESGFQCSWCFKLQRCSDSLDRHRVEWFQSSCDRKGKAAKEYGMCASGGSTAKPSGSSGNIVKAKQSSSSGISAGTAVAILVAVVILIVIIAVGAWCFYAYTHPLTPSGLALIELRNKPAQIFKRNESGTTVAGTTSSASRA